jgi:hypothetical protein
MHAAVAKWTSGGDAYGWDKGRVMLFTQQVGRPEGPGTLVPQFAQNLEAPSSRTVSMSPQTKKIGMHMLVTQACNRAAER